ncbi:uncharacterized protein LOC119642928 [Glossina fuscipes]|uniref:Uncharacterized protein LOC119642928 n=1 Tax=Glossina fuscipes TaxID=7396 RepID=A0A9C6DPN3_9MUSC|nr:uncharacterized protein LOC119642928 [Glossina fuscipes]XP_037898172.1 uncharacterized protein LOC119642928 [Glossina fuscipes]
MWALKTWFPDSFLAAVTLLLMIDQTLCLRNVSVTIPTAVKRSDNAILICNYDIENDTLYSVKWYRGRREFYRYTPKENPAWKIFSLTNPGINVDINHSNASHVWLSKVALAISGKYACEVSADAPSFHTLVSFGEMCVVELPTQRPIITGIHSRYRLGDNIDGNCSLDYTKPAANLTWWINDIQVPPNYSRIYRTQKHEAEQLESAVLEINFVVTLQHFIKGRLKLKCSARIYRIYHGEAEKYVEEDKPRIMASGRSPETYPFDRNNDEFDESNDENGLYLTRYNEYASSSAWKEKPTFLWLLINGFLLSYWRTAKFSKEIILYKLTSKFILCKKSFAVVVLVCETAGKLTGSVMNARHTLARNYYKTLNISRHQR